MGIVSAAALWAILHGGVNTNSPRVINGAERTKEDPAVVQVFSPVSRGTGFFIEGGGHKYLVTAAHVCGTFEFLISAKGIHNVLASSPSRDICVLSTYQNVATLKLGQDSNPGDPISMTGFPLDYIYNYQEGTAGGPGHSMFKMPAGYYGPGCPKGSIQYKNECGLFVTTVQLDAVARPGNSGGPVVNSDNEVVGILIATDGRYGYMSPVSELIKVLTGAP